MASGGLVRSEAKGIAALRSGLLSGSALLFASATLVNAGNYLLNLVLGRWLGPAAFADLSLIVTLFLVTSFVASGIQTPTARFAAIYAAEGDVQRVADLRRAMTRAAAVLGLGIAAVLMIGAPLWSRFFNTASWLPFAIFGAFVPFYILQAVDRGVLQGCTRFAWLAASYQSEMWSRAALSLACVALGWMVNGAVAALGLSFVVVWLIAGMVNRPLPAGRPLERGERERVAKFATAVVVAQLGQILINNSDILIVRHFFPAEPAGQYAALALIGRLVFFATWSVVMAMFPLTAQQHRRGESHRTLLFLSLGMALPISLLLIAIAHFAPELTVQVLFGPAYLPIAPLLSAYAAATALYALANIIVNYHLAIGNSSVTYVVIAGGIAQVILLCAFHADLQQVVGVQVALMVAVLASVAGWDALHARR